jgi:hypothetical protein
LAQVRTAFLLTDHTAGCVWDVAGTDQILKGAYSPDSRLVEQRGLASNAVGHGRHIVLLVRPLRNGGERLEGLHTLPFWSTLSEDAQTTTSSNSAAWFWFYLKRYMNTLSHAADVMDDTSDTRS